MALTWTCSNGLVISAPRRARLAWREMIIRSIALELAPIFSKHHPNVASLRRTRYRSGKEVRS